jgi:serine/threonine protein kinase/formylglycine-generating enzyme required for sulfatase activity/SpoVK/Ycf46/Vps4 family AAA+-type ATPase
MSDADIAQRFDQVLVDGEASARAYWLKLPEAQRRIDWLVHLQVVFLERRHWHRAAISQAVDELTEETRDERVLRELMRGIYEGQVGHGLRPHVKDFRRWLRASFAEVLRLENEPCGLGGKIADRYYLNQRLGDGGFGIVYHAFDERRKWDVAIKVPHVRYWEDPRVLSLYVDEGRAIAGLNHPGICRLLEIGGDDEIPLYLVARVLEGVSLDRWVREKRRSLREIVQLVAKTAEALQYAHSHGLTHRDIKPSNIMVDPQDQPVLLDFGIALRDGDLGKRNLRYSGTVAYMSPEQARGEGHRVDGRSDIFSLGIVLYELIAGRRPFLGPDVAEIREQIQLLDPKPLRQLDDSIPEDLERICKRMLAKIADNRYPTASDLSSELRSLVEDLDSHGGKANSSFQDTPDRSGSSRSDAKEELSPAVVCKGLRSYDKHDAEFFVRLLPGPYDRFRIPSVVQVWKSKIEERVNDETFSVGLIYGPSGCGKSSLVKAGIAPRLSSDVIVVYVEATADTTEERILAALQRACPILIDEPSLPLAFAKLRNGQAANEGKKIVLFVDQFEQWLHGRDQFERTHLVQSLRQCDGGNLQCVLLVRDDFWLAITRCFDALEIPLSKRSNLSAIDLFDRDHARTVLTLFAGGPHSASENRDRDSDELERFIDGAIDLLSEGGRVSCVRLAILADLMRGKEWHPRTLKRYGGPEGFGVAFLDETFCSPSSRPECVKYYPAARRLLQVLLPELGVTIKGKMKSFEDLYSELRDLHSLAEVEELLRLMDGELRLIRMTAPMEYEVADESEISQSTKRRFYQLTHDYLVSAVREWLRLKDETEYRGRAKRKLAERSSLWGAKPIPGLLPSLGEFLTIRCLTQAERWNESEGRMMRAAKQYHLKRTLTQVVWGVTCFALLWSYFQRSQSRAAMVALRTADGSTLSEAIEHVESLGWWTKSDLAKLANAEALVGSTGRERLNAKLALVGTDCQYAEPLVGELWNSSLEYFEVIRDRLKPYSGEIKGVLQSKLHDSASAPHARFRAAAALADYLPDTTTWSKDELRMLVEELTSANTDVQPRLRDWLRPIGNVLREELEQVYVHGHSTVQRVSAANALVSFFGHDRETMTRILVCGNAEQYRIVFPAATQHDGNQMRAALATEWMRPATVIGSTSERMRLSRQQAAAAITLLKLGDQYQWMDGLRALDDPECMTQFAHGCKERDVSFSDLERSLRFLLSTSEARNRLRQERDVRLTYALLLALGDYQLSDITTGKREEFVRFIRDLSKTHPSAGVHAAAGWLLRSWKRHEPVDEPAIPYLEGREWFTMSLVLTGADTLAGDGAAKRHESRLTFVVIPPGEYVIGSAESEETRNDDEQAHTVRITYPFAILDREISFAEMEAFRPAFATMRSAIAGATPDHPAGGAAWYDAVRFCRWLTVQAGLDEADQAYLDPNSLDQAQSPSDKNYAKEVVPWNWPVRLQARGFRLPTEAEWEIASRAGSTGAFSFGDDIAMLERYGWFDRNSRKVIQRSRQLRPNLWGIFDMHGGLFEWCHDWYGLYVIASANTDPTGPGNGTGRVRRGGGWRFPDTWCRSSYRNKVIPSDEVQNIGIRIVFVPKAAP